MNREYAQSDLAVELCAENANHTENTEKNSERYGRISVVRQTVNPADADRIGVGAGRYVTLESPPLSALTESERRLLTKLLTGELQGMAKRLTGKKPDGNFTVLVVGLGNAGLTVDAVGPLTLQRLNATRHLKSMDEELFRRLGCASLCAVAPGVLGQTGVETSEILTGVTERVKPDLAVTVDALAAKSVSRLSGAIQISDAGIRPGSGVGNRRSPLTRESLGVPVIALGVPTVVNSSTLVADALHMANLTDFPPSLERVLENGRNFFVSSKDADLVTEAASEILSRAITDAFCKSLCDL